MQTSAAGDGFRVVCLGGSAGGLQAYMGILRSLVLTRKSIHGPPWRYPELPANLSDRPEGCPAHFKARQRVTTDFPTSLHHSAGHNLCGATLIVQFTVTDELRQPDLLAQMF
jgi:hypothetical protein